MRLLIDTDAFCTLAVSDLLSEAIQVLGGDIRACERLPALPHMLRRGTLRRRYGAEACDKLLPIAQALRQLGQPDEARLNELAPIQAIDPGEALIFASAAESEALVITGDKRALGALRNVEDFCGMLSGRVVVLEALLLALCRNLGSELVRERVQPMVPLDTVIKVCFSSQSFRPEEGLLSYFGNLQEQVSPLVLWTHRSGADL